MRRKLSIMLLIAMLLTSSAFASPMLYYAPGDKVADFTLELTDGTQFVLSENQGKIVVVDLWATWCPNCVSYSLPALSKLKAAYPDEVSVIAVNCGDPAQDVLDFCAEMGYDFPVAIDEEIEVLYGYFPTSGIPYAVFIDDDGAFYTSCLGGAADVYQHYEQVIEEMLADK